MMHITTSATISRRAAAKHLSDERIGKLTEAAWHNFESLQSDIAKMRGLFQTEAEAVDLHRQFLARRWEEPGEPFDASIESDIYRLMDAMDRLLSRLGRPENNFLLEEILIVYSHGICVDVYAGGDSCYFFSLRREGATVRFHGYEGISAQFTEEGFFEFLISICHKQTRSVLKALEGRHRAKGDQ